MVGFSTLGVFAIAIRIQNNMLLLIAVALFILFLLSLVWAGRNLAGIQLGVERSTPDCGGSPTCDGDC